MNTSRTVALVGRPNVGKSRLFNSLVGRRVSIVHDMPGVTRDLVGAEMDGGVYLLDTGGIGIEPEMTPARIADAADAQVDFALETADLVIHVVDGRDGCTLLDESVAGRLRRFGGKVLLVANKIDSADQAGDTDDFLQLGLGEPLAVSAEHGRGVDALKRAVLERLGPAPDRGPPEERRIRISLVGRPNVGKSSLGNRLLNSPRLIVSDVPGTTRDSVESDLDYAHQDGETLRFRLCDTAGLRAKRKVDSPVEYFSTVRTRDILERSDVVFVVIDAMDGVTRQDQALVGEALDAGKAVIVVVNKWDLVSERFKEEKPDGFRSVKDFARSYEASLRKELFFLPDSPVLFVSALTGFRTESMLEMAASIDATLDLKLPTGPLNRVIGEMIEKRAPKLVGSRRFKVFYAVQTGNRPFRIRFFCNRPTHLEPTYRRYLEGGIQREFALRGCPVRFELVGKEKRYEEERK